ncbi:hypothetical protein [Bradyrhizobium diazoefficiens]
MTTPTREIKTMGELMGGLLEKIKAVRIEGDAFTAAVVAANAAAVDVIKDEACRVAAVDLTNRLQELGEEALTIAASLRDGFETKLN